MSFSPFWRDLVERAARTAGGGFITYVGESELTVLHLTMVDKAATFALGTAAVSSALSVGARFFGRRGTASMTRVVEYAPGEAPRGVQS